MTRKVVFRTAAKRDLSQLGAQSAREWGARRTRGYLLDLDAKIQKLAENPMLGHEAGLGRAGVRRMNSGRHAVFYVVGEERIEIVRILHVSRDAGRWV
ncbi:type II toxin-antitoxin system RelE/ParE family toxin [Erythrobacter sp. SCSIO 43205]|uniref:type II toxin-antitoxin system RelE/ParE family toxin n=1 Tax=Erythrobacter sp. SCSIO 43205 TaxID=2779361 RepID=UPI001CA95DEB|nr:type II toxin-antitoxin system RelE/ParE family toxin [Erythrobacter sp. SCSIO 43205]UAB77317.1 type II toxin-antitoxin system RelE/ParE family toxin [Erythrobacter sp. SCSIO 43205]